MRQDQSQGGRRHAVDACGLSKRQRPDGCQLLRRLGREAMNRAVVELARQLQGLVAPECPNVCILAVEVAGIAGLDLELFDNSRWKRRELRPDAGEGGKSDVRQSQEGECRALNAVLPQRDSMSGSAG